MRAESALRRSADAQGVVSFFPPTSISCFKLMSSCRVQGSFQASVVLSDQPMTLGLASLTSLKALSVYSRAASSSFFFSNSALSLSSPVDCQTSSKGSGNFLPAFAPHHLSSLAHVTLSLVSSLRT